jgi:hypothetical protein
MPISTEKMALNYLTVDKEDVSANLRASEATIKFIKKDGTVRAMKCTLKPDVIVPYEKKTEKTKEANDALLPVWDLEAAAWRTVNLKTITELVYNDNK